ncbi:MAG TPA: biotin/lipoyl-containing protein, partial [Anseongella sp.]
MNDCRITVDNDKVFQMERDGDTLLVNGEAVFPDMVQVGEGCFHVLLNNRSFNVEVVRLEAKSGQLKVNGRLYSFSARDHYDELLEKLGMAGSAAHQVNDLRAPMPGLVLRTLVTAGQTVEKGDNLLVLEAMKMENIIKSPGEGTVEELLVQPGESVEKNQILIR